MPSRLECFITYRIIEIKLALEVNLVTVLA